MLEEGSPTQEQTLIQATENWENWRKKSLNANPLQRYSVPINAVRGERSIPQSSGKQKSEQKPVPKLTKINEKVFCLLLNNSITVFQYMAHEQRLKKKLKCSFKKLTINTIPLPSNIEWVLGNGTDLVFIASCQELLIIQIKNGEQQLTVEEKWRKQMKVKSFTCLKTKLKNQLLVLTPDHIKAFDIDNNFEPLRDIPISFSSQSVEQSLEGINGIQIIIEGYSTFYFVGTSLITKETALQKLGRKVSAADSASDKKCQVLYLVKFSICKGVAQSRIFIIDYIFEQGIFKRSRAHQLGKETFIFSLSDEIIVIRRNFQKFMVWDNISIASSKGSQKKGELILADKRIMIYRESGDIQAYQLFFDFDQAQFKSPKIDSIRGNDSEEEVLYDALIFQYKPGIYMKTMFYFKEYDIEVPKRKFPIPPSEGVKEHLIFQLVCIEQTEPTSKLKQMFQLNKAQPEIDAFVKRFQISKLQAEKSKWEVSSKGEKEIQNLLLEIKDNDYIQMELTKILKEKPHELNFLTLIEKKQVERYRKMLAHNLLKVKEGVPGKKIEDEEFNLRQIDMIKLSLQWLLESKMFQRKLNYSKNFLSFKEYDFIDIGKLKATSLRQNIKLLSCKGYEKRLKYFFNSFKYLVLDDFKEILRFVILDSSQREIEQFFMDHFTYILPTYEQPNDDDRCLIWDDTFDRDEAAIETLAIFRGEVISEMDKVIASLIKNYSRIPLSSAINAFDQYLAQFMNGQWFRQNSYKQHSLLKHNLKQLKKQFLQLKQFGVFNIIIEIMYEKIQTKQFAEDKVKAVIKKFRAAKLFDDTYACNVEARIKVYQFLVDEVRNNPKQYFGFQMPSKSEFIILREEDYFALLFANCKGILLGEIKSLYEEFRKGFFVERFKKFMYSDSAKLPQLIDFLECFPQWESDDVRLEVFLCIIKQLKVSDALNTRNFITKLITKAILVIDGKFSLDNPIEEAKIVFGEMFLYFFQKFQIEASFHDLIAQTTVSKIEEASILQQIIIKYCKNYNKQKQNPVKFYQNEVNQIDLGQIDLSEVLNFTAFILYFRDTLQMEISEPQIFRQIILGFLDNALFEDLSIYITQLHDFGKVFDDRALIEDFPHYALLNNFKMTENIKKILENAVFDWVDSKYREIARFQKIKQKQISAQIPEEDQKEAHSIEQSEQNSIALKQINQLFSQISSVLQVLNSNITNQHVSQATNNLQLLQNIKTFSPQAFLKIVKIETQAKQQFEELSSFQFMMTFLQDIEKEKLSRDDREEAFQMMRKFQTIHLDFVKTFQESKKSDEVLTGEFCRFNAELVIRMIGQKLFRPAAFALFFLFNSTYYYRDIFFYFLARIIGPNISARDITEIVYEFMNIESHKQLQAILNHFVMKFQITGFVEESRFAKNVQIIFKAILYQNQLDQSFFFLVRNECVSIPEMEKICLSLNKYRDAHVYTQALLIIYIRTVKKYGQGEFYPSFTLYKSKLSTLEKKDDRMDLLKDIFIVFSQLQVQINKCNDDKKIEQMKASYDLLKQYYDKFMATFQNGRRIKVTLQNVQTVAIRFQKYTKADESLGLEPTPELRTRISEHLVAPERLTVPPTGFKSQVFQPKGPLQRIKSEDLISDEYKKIMEEKKALRDNEKRLKQIQAQNDQLLQEQFRPAITEAKKKFDQKMELSLLERKQKRIAQEEEERKFYEERLQGELGEENFEDKMDRLKVEEDQKIGEIKSQYKSKLAEDTYKMLQELRKRRQKVKEETTQTIASENEKRQKKSEVRKLSQIHSISGSEELDFKRIKTPSAAGNYDNIRDLRSSGYVPAMSQKGSAMLRAESEDRLKLMRETIMKGSSYSGHKKDIPLPQYYLHKGFEEPKSIKGSLYSSNNIERMKKQLESQKERERKQAAEKAKKTLTYNQIKQKYINFAPSAEPYFQKLQIIKSNVKAATQIMKNIYNGMEDLIDFVDFAEDMIQNIELASEVLELKSIKLVRQAVKIKIQLPLKQIFTFNLFSSVYPLTMRDYYGVAYGIIKPNLIKIMENPDFANSVNGLAIFIRYGFGSDNAYSSKVYEEYIRAMLHLYQKEKMTDGQQMKLVQKLRNTFNNLLADKRKVKFEQLINEISDRGKRIQLLKLMVRNLQGKSSLVARDSIEEFKSVVDKMCKQLRI